MRFVNGTRADDLAGRGLTTPQRLVIPLGVSMLRITLRFAGKAISSSLASAFRHPLATSVAAAAVISYLVFGGRAVLGVVAVTMLGLSSWLYLSPFGFDRHVIQPARGSWRWTTHYWRKWYEAIDGCGLAKRMPDRTVYVPKVRRVTSTRWVDTLQVRLLHGHTPEDLAKQAEGLRHAFGALRCAVIEDAPGRVRLLFFARDPLLKPVPAVDVDALPAIPNLSALPVGRTEAGDLYCLDLEQTHAVTAAATGAGKSTLTWDVLRALGPGIKAGLVHVTALDPKGGQELYCGRPLFTHYEDESPQAIAAELDAVVERMVARKRRLRGASRNWTMSSEEPFELVLVDELAALTAYISDRKLKERIAGQLQLILSQGRSVGFCVLACLQDPRKDVLPFRDLFPTRVALRLAEDTHIDMVLGDGAKDRGALCHKIPPSLPGVGFVNVDGAAEPVRVRFGWIGDDDIREMVELWPAPPVEQSARVIDLASREVKVPDQAGGPAVEYGDPTGTTE